MKAAADDRVACALAGAAAFSPACRLERTREDGQPMLVLHHPDGGFRRFIILANGAGLLEADGADIAQGRAANGLTEVAVGPDRYRIPVAALHD